MVKPKSCRKVPWDKFLQTGIQSCPMSLILWVCFFHLEWKTFHGPRWSFFPLPSRSWYHWLDRWFVVPKLEQRFCGNTLPLRVDPQQRWETGITTGWDFGKRRFCKGSEQEYCRPSQIAAALQYDRNLLGEGFLRNSDRFRGECIVIPWSAIHLAPICLEQNVEMVMFRGFKPVPLSFSNQELRTLAVDDISASLRYLSE
jgi:hypothetical protein